MVRGASKLYTVTHPHTPTPLSYNHRQRKSTRGLSSSSMAATTRAVQCSRRPPRKASSHLSTLLLLLLLPVVAPWTPLREDGGRSVGLVQAFVPLTLPNGVGREKRRIWQQQQQQQLQQQQQQHQGQMMTLMAKAKTSTSTSSSSSSSSKAHFTPPSPLPSSPSPSSSSTSSSSESEESHPHHATSVIATKLQKPNNAPTVWVEFGALAASLPPEKVINLGQGFPNWVRKEGREGGKGGREGGAKSRNQEIDRLRTNFFLPSLPPSLPLPEPSCFRDSSRPRCY